MEYNYKNESLLSYLRKYESESKKRMDLTRKIILFSFKHPEYTLEEATDAYLEQNLNKEQPIAQKSIKGKDSKNGLPVYLNSSNLVFHGKPLVNYLKENCENQFYDEKELSACLRSIQHYLQKLNVGENEVEQGIEDYFKKEYQGFLKTYFTNHLTYQNVKVDTIIKYYVQNKMPEKYNKNFIYVKKRKLVRLIKRYYNEEEKQLEQPLDLLIELFMQLEFQGDIRTDIFSIQNNDTVKKTK